MKTQIMKHFFLSACVVIILSVTTVCSTLADAKAARGTGTIRIYDKPYDVVWDAVLASIKSTSLALVVENKSDGTILAQGAIGVFSWGENVAVYVDDADGKVKTRVEIINKRALATNITAADWENRLSSAIDSRLATQGH